jgi:hypothetical protein
MNYRLRATSLEHAVRVSFVYQAVSSGHQGPTRKLYKERDVLLYRHAISFHTSTLFIQMQCTFKSLRSFFYLGEYRPILISFSVLVNIGLY